MKDILLISPTRYDARELSSDTIQSNYRITIHHYNEQFNERIICPGIGWLVEKFDPQRVLEDIQTFAEQKQFDGIISAQDYPGSILASIIAEKIGLLGPSPHAILSCQHKYISRLAQQASVPGATPDFKLIKAHQFDRNNFSMKFPLFLKPVKSIGFSVYAHHAHTFDQLKILSKQSCLPSEFIEQFNWFLQQYQLAAIEPDHILVEELLQGQQCTLEAFVFNNHVQIVGIVDSVMFDNRISFKRFEYPSHLPDSVQKQMANIAQRFLSFIKFNNGLCNIEFMYDPEKDSISIIEVNSRMCSQFADLFEKVDGINTYTLLLDISTGKKPQQLKGKGRHAMAASLVLRTFENKKVIKAPGSKELEKIYHLFPDARIQIMVKSGDYLSDAFQDGKSFRYGLVHLGGRDLPEILAMFEVCEKILDFQFA